MRNTNNPSTKGAVMHPNLSKMIRRLSPLASALVCFCAIAAAQELTTGSVVGLVREESGSVVSGASITITNRATGARRVVTSGETGEFSIPGLAPALYDLKVERSGFRAYLVEGLELKINQVARLEVRLQVGAITEAVTVTGGAALLETDTSAVGQVIDSQRVRELPLNGRNLTQLAALSAGLSSKSFERGTQYGGRDQYVTVEGGRDSSTNYLIDGVMARSLRFNNLSLQLNIDAVQEFKVNRNSFSAEFGQGQSVVTAVTRSGSNDIHGNVYEFLRNDNLDARKFFDAQKPEFRRNQFGVTAGGPIIHSKAFFFGAYEGLREAKGTTLFGTVMDPKLLTGDLSSISTSIIDPTTGQPFSGNRIPDVRISKFAKGYNKYFPAPNNAGANNYRRVDNFLDSYNSVTGRFDQNLSSRHTLFERYVWYEGSRTSPGTFTNTDNPQNGQNLSAQSTFTVTPQLVNEFKLGYNRAIHFVLPINPGGNPVQELGIRNLAGSVDPIDFGVPAVNITGFSNPGNGGITQGSIENIYTVADNLSRVFGSHTLKVGVELQHRRFFHITEVPPRGTFTFTGQYTGNAIADYLLGVPSTAGGAAGSSRSNYRSNFLGLFVQEDLRVNQRLTLNLGLRYEYGAPWKEKSGQEGLLDPTTGLITYHKLPANIPPALKGLYNTKEGLIPAGIIQPDKNNFAPRIGLAWRPFGEKTVIRAGFGVFYDNVNLNELQFTRLVAPFYANFTLINSRPRPDIFVDNLFPGLNEIARFPAPFSVDPNNRTPYVLEYNLNIQRQLGRNWVLEIGYSGSNSHKLWKRFNQNQAEFDPTGTIPLQNRLPFPQFDAGILTSANDANGHYDGGFVKVEKRYSNGLFLLSSYTFSKSIDNNSGEVEANDTRDRHNKRLDRSRSRFDQRHRFGASFGYELPFGPGKRLLDVKGVAGFLTGGWNIQGIMSLTSGFPFSVTAANVHNTGSFIPQYANRVGDGKLENPTPTRWFDLSAFTQPALGTQGNAPRNVLDGPSYKNFDFSVTKNNRLTERVNLQFRAEFFNIANHPNFGLPNGNISNVARGTIISVADGRDIQLGLKLIW
jgi:Carboxypeptidase regulatory-like domain/TonB dependent receptor-like, beta-barrel/TonB-dependent Receptor Plug Domain